MVVVGRNFDTGILCYMTRKSCPGFMRIREIFRIIPPEVFYSCGPIHSIGWHLSQGKTNEQVSKRETDEAIILASIHDSVSLARDRQKRWYQG